MTADDERQEESVPSSQFGNFAAEHLSPAFPQRAPWGTAQNLRAWQAEALEEYFTLDGPHGPGKGPRDFLAAAPPGAGKTTCALRLASELLRRRVVERIVGCHVFPDTGAQGQPETAQWLYTVVFDGRELWGRDADPTSTVSIEAWESYLEPA